MATNGTQMVEVEGTLERAMSEAMSVAVETHREISPVRIFRQGNRTMVSSVLPVRVLLRLLRYNSAERGSTADKALSATNRPVTPDHVDGIARYLTKALTEGEPYIIPPLTLNANGGIQIFLPEGDHSINSGYAVFPDETAIYITDGQHRFLGLKKVEEATRGTPEGELLMNTGVAFMMTIEADTQQVHQDFADAGRTKPLPPSLLSVYDTRQPANRAVMSIIEAVPLLNGRVDATSTTIGGSSPYTFLVNQVRQFVKHSLTGSTGASEINFGEEADAAMTNRESSARWIRSRVSFLKAITEVVPDWREVAELSPPGGADSAVVLQKTKEVKSRKNVPLNGAFLTTLGLVSNTLLSDVTSNDFDETELKDTLLEQFAPLRTVDWSRNGPLWDGNIVTGGKIRTQAPAVRAASRKILEHLGILEMAAAPNDPRNSAQNHQGGPETSN